MERVLIAEDEPELRGILADVLGDAGFPTLEAEDGLKALKLFKSSAPDIVVLDLNMPYMKGMEVMQEMLKIDQSLPVVILTGHGGIESAVAAIKAGAYDYLPKPPDFEKLIMVIRRAVEKRNLEKMARKAEDALATSLEHSLGSSAAMKKVITQIRQVAQTDYSIIIQGETGTGKSVAADLIHSISKRSGRPFVSVDIGLIPDLLVESELFGYKKGAFTGADRDKTGYLESANTGTIFVDELENMSPHVQAKLLSFLERKVVHPLGSTNPVVCDVRVITATNKEIRDCVAKKEFREDLYYRLGEFIITLPPLRERSDDVMFFARKFLFESATELGKQIRGIEDKGAECLMSHSWPGNLRELKNIMRRAALITERDAIGPETLRPLLAEQKIEAKLPHRAMTLKEALRDLERRMILDAMEKTGGNKTKAAEMLEVSYKNLFDKVKEYGMGKVQDEPHD